jgi:3-phytase
MMTPRLVALVLVSLLASRPDGPAASTPAARVQTEPVPSAGDAADDPAIWIHPDDPAKSLVLGTDKKGGLHAYSLDGKQKQLVSPGSRLNNVDLLYDVLLGPSGRVVDLAVATVSGKAGDGLKVWTIEPKSGELAEIGPGATFPTFDGGRPYGLCTYKSPRDGSRYAFVTDRDGRVEQYRLTFPGIGKARVERVRAFRVGSQSEGCVADRDRGRFYVGEENVGIWEYGAEPDASDARTLVARVGDHGLTADVEGLAIYYGPGDGGYLIASSQGSNTFNVYERAGTHAYVLTIDPRAGATDDVADTDGIDVTNERLSPAFPRGLFVVQDGKNDGHQNFKLIAWDDVAGKSLIVDTMASARGQRGRSR